MIAAKFDDRKERALVSVIGRLDKQVGEALIDPAGRRGRRGDERDAYAGDEAEAHATRGKAQRRPRAGQEPARSDARRTREEGAGNNDARQDAHSDGELPVWLL